MRAFDAGWGGAVWKTIGEPVTNVSSRYSATDWNGQRIMGFNNIELISDRTVEENLREMAEVKKRYPKNAVIASLMVASNARGVARDCDAGRRCGSGWAGAELRLPARHERARHGLGGGAGAGVRGDDYGVGEGEGAHAGAGEADAEYFGHSHGGAGGEARRGGWAVGDQHDQFDYGNRSGHVCAAAECGREELARRLLRAGGEADRAEHGAADDGRCGSRRCRFPGLAGSATWRDAAEFLLLGCGTVQVCTAAMHYGYRIVEDMAEGLDNWMREKGFKTHRGFSRVVV